MPQNMDPQSYPLSIKRERQPSFSLTAAASELVAEARGLVTPFFVSSTGAVHDSIAASPAGEAVVVRCAVEISNMASIFVVTSLFIFITRLAVLEDWI